MEKVEVKLFQALKERYGDLDVHFVHTDYYTLILIPDWKWSFLWGVYEDDEILKEKCKKHLEVPLFEETATQMVDEIYKYLMKK